MTKTPPTSRSSRLPHVVWIMADQLRADAVGFNGNAIVRTPNLDRLARQGVVFDNLYCQSSVCTASRACMITGRYLRNLQMANGSPLLPPTQTTLPQLLQRSGYRTGMFGKLHLTPQQYTQDQLGLKCAVADPNPFLEPAGLGPAPDDPVKRNYGFQKVVPHEDQLWGTYVDWLRHRDAKLGAMVTTCGLKKGESWDPRDNVSLTDVGPSVLPSQLHPSWFIAEQAAEFFEQNAADHPCYMHVSFVDPHHPWDPPQEILRDYPKQDMPLPACRDCGNVTWPASLVERASDYRAVDDDMTQQTIACYYAMIDQIDRSVGHLLDTIERCGQMDNTLFVFVSDHGELLGDYGLWRKGAYHYDSMIRLPGFISYPAALPHRRIEELVQSIDLTPTILGMLGLDIPQAMQGRDLAVPLKQGKSVGLDHVWCELYTTSWGPFVDCWTVRTLTAKLNWYPLDRVGHLFDMVADPHEQNDLFGDMNHRSLRDEMMATMLEAICEQTDPMPRVLSQY